MLSPEGVLTHAPEKLLKAQLAALGACAPAACEQILQLRPMQFLERKLYVVRHLKLAGVELNESVLTEVLNKPGVRSVPYARMFVETVCGVDLDTFDLVKHVDDFPASHDAMLQSRLDELEMIFPRSTLALILPTVALARGSLTMEDIMAVVVTTLEEDEEPYLDSVIAPALMWEARHFVQGPFDGTYRVAAAARAPCWSGTSRTNAAKGRAGCSRRPATWTRTRTTTRPCGARDRDGTHKHAPSEATTEPQPCLILMPTRRIRRQQSVDCTRRRPSPGRVCWPGCPLPRARQGRGRAADRPRGVPGPPPRRRRAPSPAVFPHAGAPVRRARRLTPRLLLPPGEARARGGRGSAGGLRPDPARAESAVAGGVGRGRRRARRERGVSAREEDGGESPLEQVPRVRRRGVPAVDGRRVGPPRVRARRHRRVPRRHRAEPGVPPRPPARVAADGDERAGHAEPARRRRTRSGGCAPRPAAPTRGRRGVRLRRRRRGRGVLAPVGEPPGGGAVRGDFGPRRPRRAGGVVRVDRVVRRVRHRERGRRLRDVVGAHGRGGGAVRGHAHATSPRARSRTSGARRAGVHREQGPDDSVRENRRRGHGPNDADARRARRPRRRAWRTRRPPGSSSARGWTGESSCGTRRRRRRGGCTR